MLIDRIGTANIISSDNLYLKPGSAMNSETTAAHASRAMYAGIRLKVLDFIEFL